MLTLPRVVERPAIPYIAVSTRVVIPFGGRIPEIMGRLFSYISENQIKESGPVFFKYNLVSMPELQMEFGVPVERQVKVPDGFTSGMLHAGRYAEVTYFGPYDNLMSVNAVLVGWARESKLEFDSRQDVQGDWFASRIETYLNSPEEEPDPNKLETTVSIKLKD